MKLAKLESAVVCEDILSNDILAVSLIKMAAVAENRQRHTFNSLKHTKLSCYTPIIVNEELCEAAKDLRVMLIETLWCTPTLKTFRANNG